MQINHEDARELGIRDGEWVWIETPRGRIRQKAKLDFGIVKGVVIVMPSWWYPELPAEEPWSQGVFESNGNVLTDDALETLDPATATWVTRGLLCKVYPCINPEDRSCQEIPLEDFKHNETFYHRQYQNLGCASVDKNGLV
jgi:anaerobic selenocysteine-containing dehydrogenase